MIKYKLLYRQIGLMIADKQPGSFSLEIEWIKAYLDY
jgi:hypothetical protein